MKQICIFILAVMIMLGTAQVKAAQLNKIAAVVNGQMITMFDLQKEALPDLARARINPNNPEQSEQMKSILRNVLDMMILDILVAQEAKRLKATVSTSEVDAELARIMKERGLTKKQFEEMLAQQKMTPDTFRQTLQKSILRQKIMSMEVGRKVIVTPQEISDYYNEHKSEMVDRTGLHMGLLVYNPNVKAASIAADVKSGKISFADACAKYSIAPNKDKMGDTGAVEWNRLNQEWAERLGKLKPGEATDLFTLQNFKAQAYLFRPGGGGEKILTLKEATPQIDAILRQPKAKGRFEDYSNQLRRKAVIDIRL